MAYVGLCACVCRSFLMCLCDLFVVYCVIMYGLRWFVCIVVCFFACMCDVFVIHRVLLYGYGVAV